MREHLSSRDETVAVTLDNTRSFRNKTIRCYCLVFSAELNVRLAWDISMNYYVFY